MIENDWNKHQRNPRETDTVQHCATLCNTVQRGATLCNAVACFQIQWDLLHEGRMPFGSKDGQSVELKQCHLRQRQHEQRQPDNHSNNNHLN